MKSLSPLLAPLVLAAALAACNKSEPEVLDSRAPDPNAAAVANAGPVQLPPAIRAQKTYRCKGDNSLFYVTWYQGDEFVDARDSADGTPTRLTSTTKSSPWTSAVGWTVEGDTTAVRVTVPGKGPRDCRS
jgi:hypothetical protein